MAPDPFHDRLSAQFDVFDRTGDGVLAREDLEAKARAVLDEFGVDPDSPPGRQLMTAADGFWDGLCRRATISPDGKMSKDDFVAANMKVLVGSPDGFQILVRPWVHAEFVVADVDQDDRLGRDEWARLLRTRGHDEPTIRQRLDAADIDGDGGVTLHEVMSAAYRFYATDDAPHMTTALD
jgi:Ca2+-binding EF-hand superfamily protein